jgi:hypothetical protein
MFYSFEQSPNEEQKVSFIHDYEFFSTHENSNFKSPQKKDICQDLLLHNNLSEITASKSVKSTCSTKHKKVEANEFHFLTSSPSAKRSEQIDTFSSKTEKINSWRNGENIPQTSADFSNLYLLQQHATQLVKKRKNRKTGINLDKAIEMHSKVLELIRT